MDPSHALEYVEVSESLGAQHRCHSDSYSVWENAKLVSPMYKHTTMPLFCYRTVYIFVSSHEASPILRNDVFLCHVYIRSTL